MMVFFFIGAVIVLGGYIYYSRFLSKKLDPAKRAEEFIKTNRVRDAVYEYRKLIDADPFDFISHFRLAEIHMSLGEYDDAAKHYTQVLEINKFNLEVAKVKVEKNLAKIFLSRDDLENSFRYYSDIQKYEPSDYDSLYYCAFIALGQEEYEISQRYFDLLVRAKQPDFETAFGAGMCSYQNQKTADAIGYFKTAMEKNPESDIASLAMAFAQRRKRDFKKAQSLVEKLVAKISDPSILFVLMRLDAVLHSHLKKHKEAVSKFEALLNYCRKNSMKEEEITVLYDLGFACLFDEQANKAYDYWNKLAEIDRNYRNIQSYITELRKEMNDSSGFQKGENSVFERTTTWIEEAFPQNFLWNICGLKADNKFDLRSIASIAKSSSEKLSEGSDFMFVDNLTEKYCALDGEKFRIVSGRILEKLGFRVTEFLTTYKENDGVDILATERSTGNKALVWVRRWRKTKIGEIPLRNFAQAINDNKARTGIFITTAPFTEGANSALEKLSKVRVVSEEELNTLLQGVIDV